MADFDDLTCSWRAGGVWVCGSFRAAVWVWLFRF